MDVVNVVRPSEFEAESPLVPIMARYAALIAPGAAQGPALVQAIAAGPERPASPAEALDRVRRALFGKTNEDQADRTIIASAFACEGASLEAAELPLAGPAATGLPMPAQDIEPAPFAGLARLLGLGPRHPLEGSHAHALGGKHT